VTFAASSNELKAEKIDGLVLDLRGNGGGYLPEATALTGLFIDKGPVVQLKVTTGELEVQDDPESGVAYAGPLAVLVDRFSASASEIFAGALQDYHRATILGQRTFGKGTVQNLVPLDPGRRARSMASSSPSASSTESGEHVAVLIGPLRASRSTWNLVKAPGAPALGSISACRSAKP
jgi:C-terminal peptidase prc